MHYPNFSECKVVVIGDVMLDRYLHGDTSRISPEAPVPVVNIHGEEERVGGAANVAVNVAALGARCTLIAAIGQDEAGAMLKKMLLSQKVDCDLIESTYMSTITKLRVIGRQQQLLRLDFEKYYAWSAKSLEHKLEAKLSNAKVLIISDYAKGMIAEPQALIQFAKARGIRVVVDPKNEDLSVYQGADILTPNMKEFEAMVGECHSDDDIVMRAQALIHQYNFEALLITRGAHGMTLVEKHNNQYHHIPAKAREVFDITGAGDTVVAVLATCLGLDKDYLFSAKLSNVAAGISVGKLGTATIGVEELDRHFSETDINRSISGVVNKNQLLLALKKHKAQNQKIVMTNGCFDLLHTGHLAYLQEAKALGDCLVVAVNDDDSVKRLKGESRPLNRLHDRMLALAALKSVDYVVSFSEDTPRALISDVLPDVLVKGGDYETTQIAGAQEVMANGGEVKILQFVDGYSTTQLVERIHQSNQQVGEVV
ncbi:bifunctional D-glycero-beta-D-manno-heptose-7-phosphate kinase/D-glycero-beta-D-manno-heptose 1-phosphate adenylyltransferase HldE [Candidatus Berkiella cookevillensis]